ncbi:hypothetical protein [Prosthecobacter sp.]|uniref:hypothetical protein n=1 Tax=Prosthecobacter sp. TaxID=1965333 RepID=UPI0037844B28
MKANPSSLSGKAGFCLLGATAILTLASCDPAFFGPGYGGGGYSYAPAYNRSNYTYYPKYRTYYHPQTNMYHYHNGSSWVSSPHPYGVNHTVIRSSPSVPLYLNSHPQYHHNNVQQQYPHHWNGSHNNNWHH